MITDDSKKYIKFNRQIPTNKKKKNVVIALLIVVTIFANYSIKDYLSTMMKKPFTGVNCVLNMFHISSV